jgi:hypothetical protein
MQLGDRTLKRGMQGKDVVELQLRLSGFRGTVWDGDFGPGTELQVVSFQKDYMGGANPSGVVDAAVIAALERFADEHKIAFDLLKCACGQCGGFGKGGFKGEYQSGKPHVEAFHRYEYPGIHKAILHAYRAAWFYAVKTGNPAAVLTSGYRCWIRNEQKRRSTTNHMGKAIDMDFPSQPGEDKRDDCLRCDNVRGVVVEKSNFQTGWGAHNRKSLEPSNIAPTWIHMDVRSFAPSYLDDAYFVKSAADLDGFDIQDESRG